VDVVCLSGPRKHQKRIAEAMSQGIRAAGDNLVTGVKADACVAYGWKGRSNYQRFPGYAYADLGYWHRDAYYRFAVNGWSPDRYVGQGLPATRFERLGLRIRPWRTGGREIVVAGSTAKACTDHGIGYQEWERKVIAQLQGCGRPLAYRPKPNDLAAGPIAGAALDRRPVSEMLASAYAVVTHHSNTAIDALLAGVPVHCETGAAAAFSVPLDQIAAASLLEGREQFLFDVAWLQWTLEEMRTGECWKHLRQYL